MKRRSFVLLGVLLAVGLFVWLVFPHLLPLALSAYRSDIAFVVPTKQQRIYLTIDDAPSVRTDEILAVLKKHNVTATFFVIGNRVDDPARLQRITAAGHALGNHLKTTRACSKLSLAEFKADYDVTASILKPFGQTHFFRPPSDFGTTEQMAYVRAQGCLPVVGTVFPLDHWIHDPEWLLRLSDWLSLDGGIIILHDGPERGATTVKVLEALIPKLKARGYTFGRLDQDLTSR